jgi:hypothetical protein
VSDQPKGASHQYRDNRDSVHAGIRQPPGRRRGVRGAERVPAELLQQRHGRTNSDFSRFVKERFSRSSIRAFKAVDETGLHDELSRAQRIDIKLTIPSSRRDTRLDVAPAVFIDDRVRDRPVRVYAYAPPYRRNVAEDEVLDRSSKTGCGKGHVLRPKNSSAVPAKLSAATGESIVVSKAAFVHPAGAINSIALHLKRR